MNLGKGLIVSFLLYILALQGSEAPQAWIRVGCWTYIALYLLSLLAILAYHQPVRRPFRREG